ncbi:hypothetical protein Rrhod_0563 [Rhodococcus rhodnii LMG 5362]|uniref:Uncharacterized protein n=1 Tax=Rhodococcus rhodnii LMG 5362 TaxID=1273125 RepID=R7WV96_9NOCA|nr:hypothetical protein Rrhod_0563 [Rhodococcus rhodnii LMG 5362]
MPYCTRRRTSREQAFTIVERLLSPYRVDAPVGGAKGV